MKTIFECYINNEYSGLILRPEEINRRFPAIATRVRVDIREPLYKLISETSPNVRGKSKYLFYGWNFIYKYTEQELAGAQFFHVKFKSWIELAGNEFGTLHDAGQVCPVCHTGQPQIGPLIIPYSKIPKKKDVVFTIANEVIVSQTFVDVVQKAGLKGFVFSRIMNTAKDKPSDRIFYQLMASDKRCSVSKKTLAGTDPFDLDEKNEYRCTRCRRIGLNLLSELFLDKNTIPDLDFFVTEEAIGQSLGYLRVQHPFVFSKRARQVFIEAKLAGLSFDIAHAV